jgi:hypothetical protein
MEKYIEDGKKLKWKEKGRVRMKNRWFTIIKIDLFASHSAKR